jgi:prepilin-type N-terminal cleavage/methylation domain-containing protein
MRRGFTLVEIVTAISILGILAVIFVTKWDTWLDRLAVARAGYEIAAFYQTARFGAIYRSSRVRIELTPDSLRAVYEGVADSTFLAVEGPAAQGVSLSASRAVIWVHPSGVGAAGANTKIVLRRGMAAESLTTSRIGRLKRWR